ncbi:MAG: hypothetical protein AB1403_04745 [Candidatus Riflebacteria bacterium]
MFCPVCRSEFREGFTECKSCQVKLVSDLNDLSEKVDGEFLLCTACEKEFHDQDITYCDDCGLKLVRSVLQDDTYVFLEEPSEEYQDEGEMVPEMPDFKHLTTLSEEDSTVLIESEDVQMLVKIQQLLNKNGIDFDVKWPKPEKNPLGFILGLGSPVEREFPKILVRPENEEAAIRLIVAEKELGLSGPPPELMDCDDEDESDDDYEEE